MGIQRIERIRYGLEKEKQEKVALSSTVGNKGSFFIERALAVLMRNKEVRS